MHDLGRGSKGRAQAMADLATAEGRRAEIAKLEPDFHGLLERKALSQTIQAQVAAAGVVSLSRFSSLADTKAEIRTFCQDALGLHRVNDAVSIAAVVDAWTAAQTRMEVRHKAEAEADLSGMPQILNKAELQDLRSRFETSFYVIEENEKAVPCDVGDSLRPDRVRRVEGHDLGAVSVAGGRRDGRDRLRGGEVGADQDPQGLDKEGVKPSTPEQLRQRLKLVGHTMLFAQLKYPHKAALRGLEPLHWSKLAGYLLGEHIMGLESKDARGEVVAKPSFELVLSYEHQIRRNMVKLMNQGESMVEALKTTMTDMIVKERYFLTPNVASALIQAREERPRSMQESEADVAANFLGAAEGQRQGEEQEGQRERRAASQDAGWAADMLRVEQRLRALQV